MNLSTVIIAGIILVLVILAVRHTHRHGTCNLCEGGCSGTCSLAAQIPFDKIHRELEEERRLKENDGN